MAELILKIADYPSTALMDRANKHGLWSGTLEVSHLLDHRATMSFKLLTQWAVFVPEWGRKVELFDPSGVQVFGGTIDEVTQRMRRPGVNLEADLEVTCLCTDWNQYLQTLYIDAMFIGGTAGEAVLKVFGQTLVPLPPRSRSTARISRESEPFPPCPNLRDEGFLALPENILDGAELATEIFDRVTVAEFLTRMAELSVDDEGNSYIWYVAPDKKVYFGPRSLSEAPFAITDSSGTLNEGSFELIDTRKDYATEVFLRFAPGVIEDTAVFVGDNFARQFPKPGYDDDPEIRPIRAVVRVDVDGEEQTVGLAPESENPGSQWYYTPGGTEIIMSDATPAALTPEQTLTVVTQAFGADLIGAVNNEAVAEYADLTGGQGRLQLLVERTEMTDTAAIQQTVDRILAKASKKGQKIRFRTYRAGLMPSQLLNVLLGGHNLVNEKYVIDQVDIHDEDGVRLVYSVTAHLATAERIRNEVDFFSGLINGTTIAQAGAGIGPPGTVTFTPSLRDRFGFIGVTDLVATGSQSALTELHVGFAYVNEPAGQKNYVAFGDIDGISDPVTAPATAYGDSSQFQVGSLIVINDQVPDLGNPGRRSYEIFKLQEILVTGEWVLQRAQLESEMLAHDNGLKGYLVEWENLDPALGKGLFETAPPLTASGLPDRYWQLLPGACVVAVAAQLRNAAGAGPVKVVNTNLLSYPVPETDHTDNPAPGLRTLADEDYSLPISGRLSVGKSMTHRKRIRESFCLAGSGCRVRIAPAGTAAFDGVLAAVDDVALAAYLLYLSPPLVGQPHGERLVAVLDQWTVGDNRFHSERESSFLSQRRDPYNLKWPYRARVVGILQDLFNLQTGAFITDNFPLSLTGAEIPTEEGGELDVLIAAVGSTTPGTDLMGFLLT